MPTRLKMHKPERMSTHRHEDDKRGTAQERGYGSRWQKARFGFLRKHPLCAHCEHNGVAEPATVVDHVIPHKGDMGLFWNRDNWQPLCKMHHDRKTATEDGGFGRMPKGQARPPGGGA